jgi:hypothetical protein
MFREQERDSLKSLGCLKKVTNNARYSSKKNFLKTFISRAYQWPHLLLLRHACSMHTKKDEVVEEPTYSPHRELAGFWKLGREGIKF